MPTALFDMIILGLVLGMTYALSSEGLWGSALMFFNALFASLISFNFYEPLADLIIAQVSAVANYADSFSMMILFVVPLLIFRLTTDSLGPSMVRFPKALYHLGRWVFAFGGSALTVGMVLLAYQASPVQKKMIGVMDYAYKPFYGERFDRDFLAFFQYTTGYTFARNGAGPSGDPEFPNKPILFDPKAKWLIVHQAKRPYGTEAIIEEAPAEGGAAGAAPANGQPVPGGPGQMQGPGGRPAATGPGIPGGTAGAAAGLAPTTP